MGTLLIELFDLDPYFPFQYNNNINNKLHSQFCGWYLEPRAKCQDQLSIAGLVTGSIWLPKNISDQIDLATLDQ